MTESLLTVDQAAELMQLSPKFVRRLIWAHEIRHHRLGRAIRIPREALAEYLQRNEVVPA